MFTIHPAEHILDTSKGCQMEWFKGRASMIRSSVVRQFNTVIPTIFAKICTCHQKDNIVDSPYLEVQGTL